MGVSKKTMCDVCDHSSLPTSVLGLLEMKTEEYFAWVVDEQQNRSIEYLALHKHISTVKVNSTNADTTVENAHTVKSA